MFTTSRLIFRNINQGYFFRISKVSLSQQNGRATFLSNVLEDFNIKSSADWGQFREHVITCRKDVNLNNVDALTLGLCMSKQKHDLALLYLEYLEEAKIQLNLATMGKYLRLLYHGHIHQDGDIDEKTERKIIELCDSIKAKYPLLDHLTLDNFVQAISLTKNWRLGLDCLEEIRVVGSPTSGAVSALIAAAFAHNENEMAWKLWVELLEQVDKVTHSVVYRSYFRQLKNTKNIVPEIEKLFSFLQENNIVLHEESVRVFLSDLKSLGIGIKSSFCNHRGVCQCCRSQLEIFDPTEKEFEDLKQKIFQNVIIGKNVFNKTTPEEVDAFQQFISTSTGFDVIVDGLNVAYSVGVYQTPRVFAHLVAAVVSYFAQRGKKVLVIGRNHMNKWPKDSWNFVKQNAALFLTDNLSQDDPYLLYAALHSGKNTIIVSKDLMRSHKHLLRDKIHLRNVFDRWLFQHQYQLLKVLANGRPLFNKPQLFSHITQRNGKHWHIPYNQKEDNRNSFLCIEMTR